MNTITPHKHAAVIKAWADGAAIEYRPSTDRTFEVIDRPCFDGPGEYRITPVPVTPEPPVRHQWQDCIDAQAAGKKMQLRGPCQKDWDDARSRLTFNDVETLYRVKPETVSYRIGIINDGLKPRAVNMADEYQDKYFESQPNFVRWLGPRQTVEV